MHSQITVALTAEDAQHLNAIVRYYACGPSGIELSREDAVRVAVRELAERCRHSSEGGTHRHEPIPHRTSADALDAFIHDMARTPGSGVAMCHEQGKTAVYLSEDGRSSNSAGVSPIAGPRTRPCSRALDDNRIGLVVDDAIRTKLRRALDA